MPPGAPAPKESKVAGEDLGYSHAVHLSVCQRGSTPVAHDGQRVYQGGRACVVRHRGATL